MTSEAKTAMSVLPVTDKQSSQNKKLEVVVAHFNEDLSWLMPIASEATIYVKGNPPTIDAFQQTIKLPNIGREGHTFLHHLVSRYDTLADITIFVQGSRENTDGSGGYHTNMTILEIRDKALQTKVGEITLFGSTADGKVKSFDCWGSCSWLHDSDCEIWLKRLNPHFLPADYSPAEFWYDTFSYQPPTSTICPDGAFFAVCAETVRLRTQDFYEKLLGKFIAVNHANPEIGHMVEKFWVEIFTGTLLRPS